MSDFELNKPGFYEVQNVSEIEDFDPDQYGNVWYNVKFVGDAGTHMWLAKNPPEEGKSVYGHFEKTKSGKRLRFKTDKEPEDVKRPSNAKPAFVPKNEMQVTLNMVWKNLVSILGVPDNDEDKAKFWEIVDEHTTELILMGEKLNIK